MALTEKDILDAINGAIDLHVQNGIKNLNYNKSELCEITDITNRDTGWYTVYNGSARYLAYSSDTTLTVGTKVYVNIPNNDFSQQKTITSVYHKDGESTIYYNSPLKGYDPLTPNLATSDVNTLQNGGGEFGLTANNADGLEIEIVNTEYLFNNPTYNGYKYMGISADFKTRLKSYNLTSGDYGLRIYVYYSQRPETTEAVVDGVKMYTLDTDDMVGDIYNFNSYFSQEVLYDISDLDVIKKVRVVFYQGNNFTSSGNLIEPAKLDGNAVANIFMNNLAIYFGNAKEDNGKDILELYTLNGNTYDSVQSDDLNKKLINIKWQHRNPDTGNFETIETVKQAKNMSDIENLSIHWYQDSLHTISEYKATVEEEIAVATSLKELCNSYLISANNGNALYTDETQDLLVKVIQSLNLTEGTDYVEKEVTVGGESKKVYEITYAGLTNKIQKIANSDTTSSLSASDELAGEFWIPLEGDDLENTFIPDTSRQECAIKVIIEYGPQTDGVYDETSESYERITSAEYTFSNLTDLSASEIDVENGLTITIEDGSGGSYPLYSSDTNMILTRADATKARKLTAHYTSRLDGSSLLNGNEQIIWKVPAVNTMLSFSENTYRHWSSAENKYVLDVLDKDDSIFTEYNSTIGDYDGNYVYITRKAESTPSFPVDADQTYYIDQYFSKRATNNVVFCYVIKNNTMASAAIAFTFSQYGSSGTDYTFNLSLGEMVDSEWNIVGPAETSLAIGEKNYHKINFSLFNSANEEIELTSNQKSSIINLWREYKSSGYYSGNTNANGGLEFIIKDSEVAVKVKTGVTDISKLLYITLKASVAADVDTNDLGKISFTQYLPLHIRAADTDTSMLVMTGPDYVIYNDMGTDPQCDNDAYALNNLITGESVDFDHVAVFVNGNQNRLVNNDETTVTTLLDEEGNVMTDASDEEITVTGADTEPDEEETEEVDDITEESWFSTAYPYIDEITSTGGTNKLVPVNIYLSDNKKLVCVNFYTADKEVIYSCPLVIMQNKYQVPAVNEWNGQLKIDEQSNRVMAAMLAAGHKNSNNTFSGVLIGDVTKTSGTKSGILGYDNGAETFSLTTDGLLTLGASGYGQITMNGNKGTIESGNYIKDTSGMLINLQDGYVNAANFELKAAQSGKLEFGTDNIEGQGYIKMSAVADKNPILQIKADGKTLFNISNNSYYLQSKDYTTGEDGFSSSGTKIDLSNGSITSKNFYINSGGSASFKGTITSTAGTIGGWTIGSNSLSANGITLSSTGSISATGWSISSNGIASFSNINVSGGAWVGGSITGGSLSSTGVGLTGCNYSTIGALAAYVDTLTTENLIVKASFTYKGNPASWQQIRYLSNYEAYAVYYRITARSDGKFDITPLNRYRVANGSTETVDSVDVVRSVLTESTGRLLTSLCVDTTA